MKTPTNPALSLLRFIYRDGNRSVYINAHNETAALKALPFTVKTAYPKERADYWQAFVYSGNEIVYWTACEPVMIDDAGRRWSCHLVLQLDTECEVFAGSRDEVEAKAFDLCARLNAGINAQFAVVERNA